ncbi:MAG: metalloregulator ArsR/SmtB family transcription factor [Ruminococcus sp.]|nr:metalloregulator ArsR/SmtB family transcription factor [Ruminococcus sp.]
MEKNCCNHKHSENRTHEMPDLEVLFDLADLFKVFGDSTRIRIMFTISDNEMSVLSIAEALNMEQSTISHQLRVLRQNKLVRVRREGKQIYYSLDDEHVKRIIEMGLDHVLE